TTVVTIVSTNTNPYAAAVEWTLRRKSPEQSNPSEHTAARTRMEYANACNTSFGSTPPNANESASNGREQESSSRRYNRLETNFPHQISGGVSRVVNNDANVRCSFSIVIAPALNTGAMSNNTTTWEKITAKKIAIPMSAPCVVLNPCSPLVSEYANSTTEASS